MKEPLKNIGFVHPSCASKPKPELTKGKPLEGFISKWVKTSFSGKDPSGKSRIEHMWVVVESVKDGKFIGRLDNDPQLTYDPPLADGMEVTVDPEHVEELLD